MTIIKKDGHLSKVVENAFKDLIYSKKACTYWTAGKYRNTRYTRSNVGKALDLGAFEFFGIEYTLKNTAPRGGKLGEYLEISEKMQDKIKAILLNH